MYFQAPADDVEFQHSTSSRVLKMGSTLIVVSCLVLVGFMTISADPKPQITSAVESTSFFGMPGSSAAKPSAMMPKTFPNLRRSVTASAIQSEVLGDRYGRALMDTSKAEGKVEENHEALEPLRVALNDVPALRGQLSNPAVKEAEKFKLLEKIGIPMGKDTTPSKFVGLLMKEGRLEIMTEALNAFEKAYLEAGKTVVATVKVAQLMDEEEELEMAKKVKELAGCKSVKIKQVVDTDLIGGFVLQYGSKLIDASIVGQLKKMSRELEKAE